jgi:hypothetical protein
MYVLPVGTASELTDLSDCMYVLPVGTASELTDLSDCMYVLPVGTASELTDLSDCMYVLPVATASELTDLSHACQPAIKHATVQTVHIPNVPNCQGSCKVLWQPHCGLSPLPAALPKVAQRPICNKFSTWVVCVSGFVMVAN